MNHRKRPILFALITAAAALAVAAPPALAQHSDAHGQPDKHGQAGGRHESPKSYTEAIAEIDERLENIDRLIKARNLDTVHAEAQVIVDVANTLAQLALKPDSGVARESIKEINKTAKELAARFDPIDKAGDSGDEAGTRKVYAEMVALQATLRKFAPAAAAAGEHAHDSYSCPMRCEGDKAYDNPGQCPVCKMNLKKLTNERFSVDVRPIAGSLEAGKPVTLLFTLKDPVGLPVKTVEIVHEKPLHLLMVSKDLSWFAHEHPTLQPDGTFTFTWTFPAGGEYTLFHDFTPKDVGMQVVPVTLMVDGAAPVAKPLAIDTGAPKTIDGYTVTLDTGGSPNTGDETHLSFTITKAGKPVTTLAPYLGAMGHLVIISEDRNEFIHSHPHESGPEHASANSGPTVDFEARFDMPGLYKGWGQFNVGTKNNEHVVTAPFTFNVLRGASTSQAKPHDHAANTENKDAHDHK